MANEDLERLSTIFTGVLVVCALMVTGMVVRREIFPPARAGSGQPLPPLDVSARWSELTSKGHRIGPADAPIRVVVFSDFQCPFCASVQPTLREMRNRAASRIAILYRHFPLSAIHPFARQAAVAAACADAQQRFEPYHDRLFAEQDSIGVKPWAHFAKEAGVANLVTFESCVNQARLDADVERDLRLGQRLGVSGTPTFIVDGRMLRAAPTLKALEQLLKTDLSLTQLSRPRSVAVTP
jgi:protein-disulfide isomerase